MPRAGDGAPNERGIAFQGDVLAGRLSVRGAFALPPYQTNPVPFSNTQKGLLAHPKRAISRGMNTDERGFDDGTGDGKISVGRRGALWARLPHNYDW